jgi:sirohydrochlorin cobaltochelatase
VRTSDPRRALVLVGHGSHLNPDSSAPVYQHAATIRRLGVFSEVLEAFWKEEPSLRDALDLVEAPEALVVPLFLAEGYFTRQVLPRELGLTGQVTERPGCRVRYCAPVGTHPAMATMILGRAEATADRERIDRASSALVVIGHGSERSATSGGTVYRLVEELRRTGRWGTVTCGFLDEEPGIATVLDSVRASHVILVPFFVAQGWHTAETIPQDLGLTGEVTRREGRTIYYTPPVGILPEMADVILAIASEESAAADRNAGGTAAPAPTAQLGRPPIVEARERFGRWLAVRAGTTRWLQVAIQRDHEGFYSIRHTDDLAVPAHALRWIAEPDQLAALTRTRADGGYRPLRTSDDLPGGWILTGLSFDGLWSALSLVYPATVLHWHLGLEERLAVVPLDVWAARQTGAYSVVKAASPADVAAVIQSCCGRCTRVRCWPAATDEVMPGPGTVTAAGSDAAVPCREPCTVFATVLRERLSPSG